MISYGAEGYRWPVNVLALTNNTLVDDLPESGHFLRVWAGDVTVAEAGNRLVRHGIELDDPDLLRRQADDRPTRQPPGAQR